MDANAKMRKREVDLKSLGAGVMLFGLWSLIKFTISYLVYGIEIEDPSDTLIVTLSHAFYWTVLGLAVLLRLYIGKSARSESEGKHKNAFYLILSGVIVLIDALAIGLECYLMLTEGRGVLTFLITMVVDTTSLIVLIELMVNAIAIRKTRKKGAAA